MLIQFKEGILEYANGEYHRKNDGKPFDVDKRFAEEVLLRSGSFEAASVGEKQPKQVEKADAPKPKGKKK